MYTYICTKPKNNYIHTGPMWPPFGTISKHAKYLNSSVSVCIFVCE